MRIQPGSQMICLAALLASTSAWGAAYKIDTVHSNVGFAVKHMMISTVNGQFRDFGGQFGFDPKTGELQPQDFTVQSTSIDTGNADRDKHLRSEDFFDVAKCPTLTVTKSKVKKLSGKNYEWTGDLQMHCVTKPVKFKVVHGGVIKDMKGENRAAFTASAKIKRSDWGLKWNKALETGGLVVSDDVQIEINIEGVEVK